MVEIYVSTDIEADGPLPGINSMLSLGAAAYLGDGTLLSTYSANLECLPDARRDPDTMKWWATEPEAWAMCRIDLRDPEVVIPEFIAWVKSLPGKPVFVGFPACFDFAFVNYYTILFGTGNPFGFKALDMGSYAMGVLGLGYSETQKRNMPPAWFDPNLVHNHVAVDDAVEQGATFCKMLQHRCPDVAIGKGQSGLPSEEAA